MLQFLYVCAIFVLYYIYILLYIYIYIIFSKAKILLHVLHKNMPMIRSMINILPFNILLFFYLLRNMPKK